MEKGKPQDNPTETMTAEKATSKSPGRFRQDCLLFGLSLIAYIALMAATFGLGYWRHWDAPSGYFHNQSDVRFLPEPSEENDPLPQFRGRSGRPDLRGQWYYWKNKPVDITTWSRLFVWLGYSAHQISIWVVTYLAQVDRIKSKAPRKGVRLNKYNWWAFGLNTFFHFLHLVQTQVTYDGLAQDTTITSSQSSVIMLLAMVLVLEYNERGLFFGWPNKKIHKDKFSQKLTLNMKPTYLVRKYHGYAFAWASCYTIWYHPMENTYGHALGFFHTWIILVQGSLMYTNIHWNRWWRLLLEIWVIIHSTFVAIQTGEPGNLAKSLWPMFLFGLSFLFAFNQIYILPFWEKIPQGVRAVPPLVYIAIAVGAFSRIPDSKGRYWTRLQDIIRIPPLYYVVFLLIWAIIYLGIYIDKKIYGDAKRGENLTRKVVYLVATVLIYVTFVTVSIVLELLNVPLVMFVSTVLMSLLFSIGAAVATVLAIHIFPQYNFNDSSSKVHPSDTDDDKTAGSVDATNGKIAMAYVTPEESNDQLPPKPGTGVNNGTKSETSSNKDDKDSLGKSSAAEDVKNTAQEDASTNL